MKIRTQFLTILSVMVGAIVILSAECNPPSGDDSGNQQDNSGNQQGGDGTGNKPDEPKDPGPFDTWMASEDYKSIVKSMDGTAISSIDDLKGILAGGTYHLTKNIDIDDQSWTALHSKDAPFTGTLYGNGYMILNMMISTTGNYQGLFSALKGATVKDLGIGVKSIEANAAIGVLAGYAEDSTLTNIAVAPQGTAKVQTLASGTNIAVADNVYGNYVGGVVGYLNKTMEGNLTLKAYNLGVDVQGKKFTGGLVGYNKAGIVTGYATGAVTGTADTGGLVGESSGSVIGYATGAVSGTDNVGGLVGIFFEGTVIGYATGAVSGASKVGGLVGYTDGTLTGYATGAVSATGNYAGGLVGHNYSGTVKGYARGSITRTEGSNTSFGAVLGAGSSTTALFSSSAAGESRLLQFGGIDLRDAKGVNGIKINMDSSTQQSAFNGLNFIITWKWVANGKWPAINIGNLGGNSATDKQPTAP